MEKKYNIVFKGKLVLGYHIQDVRDELAAKFKLDGMALGRLFSGDPQILKRALDLDTAQKFLQMMEKIGARCEMEAFDPARKISSQSKESINKTSDGQITCPKCGFRQERSEVCSRCGLLIRKYKTKDTPLPEPEPEAEEEPPTTEDAKEPYSATSPPQPKSVKQRLAFISGLSSWTKWLLVGILWIVLIVVIFVIAVPSVVEQKKKAALKANTREAAIERKIQTEDAVLRPTFSAEFGEIRVGTAFITHFEENNQYLLVTAHGLFGSRGGLSKEYKWDELSRIISKVKAISIGNPSKMVLTNTWLEVPDAAPSKTYDSTQDIAALYLISDFGMGSLPLSQALPTVDEKVWLLAEMPNRGKQFRFSARISEVNEKAVQYIFDDADLDPGSVIGAPVVNAESKVVAINTMLISKDNKLIGIGNPAPTARQKLLSAMAQ
jgi:DNA-directed RNA polymerase subunit RPC12/RpoP